MSITISITSEIIHDKSLREVCSSFGEQMAAYKGLYRLSTIQSKDNDYYECVSLEIFSKDSADIFIPATTYNRPRTIMISSPDDKEELSRIRDRLCKQLKYKEKDDNLHVLGITTTCDGYVFGIIFYHDVPIPKLYPFRQEEDDEIKISSCKMVVNTDRFNLTDNQISAIISRCKQPNCPVYVSLKDTTESLTEYCVVKPELIQGVVNDITNIIGENNTNLLLVKFSIVYTGDKITALLKEQIGNLTLCPRMIGNNFICFDLLQTAEPSSYTIAG